jgi:NhaP-type Na+/H+ or K+/H+ antiporter
MIFLSLVNESFFSALMVLALIIGVGALLGRLMELVKIPSITGYFVSGILIGILLLSLELTGVYDSLSVLGNIALAFIAFELGTRLHRSKIMHGFSEVVVIVLFQAVFTIGLVMALFMLFDAPWEIALIVGVIAMATSPETIMVLTRKYKTKGHLTDAIMPHIGMDDILGVVLFSIVLAIATAVDSNSGVSSETLIWEPVLEILGSAIGGAVLGTLLAFFINTTHKGQGERKTYYLMGSVFVIVLITALTSHTYNFGEIQFILSPILTPMFAGIFMTNFTTKEVRKENDEVLDSFTPPFILVFFALIGVQLVISVESTTIAIGLLLLIAFLYAVVRVIGKQLGVFTGSRVKDTPKSVVKYLVRCLLPQATVSIGMAQIVLHNEALPEYWREVIFIVVLFAGILYQLIGPFTSQRALIECEEIDPEQLAFFLGDKTDGHEHIPTAFEVVDSEKKDATH